jgi:hypothetical protein
VNSMTTDDLFQALDERPTPARYAEVARALEL